MYFEYDKDICITIWNVNKNFSEIKRQLDSMMHLFKQNYLNNLTTILVHSN